MAMLTLNNKQKVYCWESNKGVEIVSEVQVPRKDLHLRRKWILRNILL